MRAPSVNRNFHNVWHQRTQPVVYTFQMLDRIRFVLVRPQTAGNIGSACRAMMNMGVTDLVLVSPECDRFDPQAIAYSARARPMLKAARVVETLPQALADCVLTFATSGKGGFHRRRVVVDAAEGARLAIEATANGPMVIAFGPEDRGLLQEEILQFDRVIEIAANPVYPAMNLAAAVMIMAYEVRQASLTAAGIAPVGSPDPLAVDEHKRAFYEKLFVMLDGIGFFRNQQNPDHLKYALRRIFGRANLTTNETDVLIGMVQQIERQTNNS